jgi:acrylyl-CoA reductase (NADPH)/3-hydroxypropionyl-CoA dehydratase/3-hydroxypropionyl-CoA synthetase
VRIATEDERGGATRLARGRAGEKGELVITQPYPYLARTIWGDADKLGSPSGAATSSASRRSTSIAGPTASPTRRATTRAPTTTAPFTLHGRSDDVINVSGHRIGTEEIEGAILRDKTCARIRPLGNAVVVGAPHDEKGETPVAFLIPAPGPLGDDDFAACRPWCAARRAPPPCRRTSSWSRVPGDALRQVHAPHAARDPPRRTARRPVDAAQSGGRRRDRRDRGGMARLRPARGRPARSSRATATCASRTHEIAPGRFAALLVIDSPPVNSLNERSLDELNTVLQHLAQQEQIEGVVITGARNAFVAGADVKELLEVGEAGDLESAQTPPNAAHTAFSPSRTSASP